MSAVSQDHRCGHNFPIADCPYPICDAKRFQQRITDLEAAVIAADATLAELRTWHAIAIQNCHTLLAMVDDLLAKAPVAEQKPPVFDPAEPKGAKSIP